MYDITITFSQTDLDLIFFSSTCQNCIWWILFYLTWISSLSSKNDLVRFDECLSCTTWRWWHLSVQIWIWWISWTVSQVDLGLTNFPWTNILGTQRSSFLLMVSRCMYSHWLSDKSNPLFPASSSTLSGNKKHIYSDQRFL